MTSYQNNEITVRFNAKICIHSGNCLRFLPAVFDINKKPWINVDAGNTKSIKEIIDHCPSGALSYEIPRVQDQ